MMISIRSAGSRALLLIGTLFAACAGPTPRAGPAAPAIAPLDATARPGTRVLVFSRDYPFVLPGREPIIVPDTSRGTRIEAIRQLGRRHGFAVEHAEESAVFADTLLDGFSAVVFLNTSPTRLTSAEKSALQRFVRGGGGVVAVEALSGHEQERTWSWLRGLIGARFRSVWAQTTDLLVKRTDSTHLSTRAVPRAWIQHDFWEEFGELAPDALVLATLDEASRPEGKWSRDYVSPGPPYPITWAHDYDGGRAWFAGLGRSVHAYSSQAFLNHLAGGILWAAGQ
ncbi:MAG: ThuA domain-containing protein [Gemmatimonadetes bacterium]|nr:ThuA domain-containing protein [Gemmatimonadota bacterium]